MADKNDKNLVCKICGREFRPRSWDKKEITTKLGETYDTFDCPRCGCQVVANRRIVEGEAPVIAYDEAQLTNMVKMILNSVYGEKSKPKDVYTYRINDVVFATRADASDVFEAMHDVLNKYGVVSVSDYYDLCGIRHSSYYVGCRYGWTNLDEVSVLRKANGYVVHMPPATPII